MSEAITTVQAIDVHAHFGLYGRDEGSIKDKLMTADAPEILRRARKAHIEITVVSALKSLMPRGGGDAFAGNIDAEKAAAENEGLMHWVVIDPRQQASFEQASRMLGSAKCAGIKMHPEEHLYHVSEFGRAIFEFAAKRGAVLQSHSGEQNSRPEDYVQFADDFPEVTLILSHLGCTYDEDVSHQVRAIQMSKHGNIYTDTSSASSIMPKLIEWAVGEVGAEKILFGSDSPCYYSPMQRARIDTADLDDHQKRLILRENALRVLPIQRQA